MKIFLVSKCSLDIEQYAEFKMSVLISPSKSLISSRWVKYSCSPDLNNFSCKKFLWERVYQILVTRLCSRNENSYSDRHFETEDFFQDNKCLRCIMVW